MLNNVLYYALIVRLNSTGVKTVFPGGQSSFVGGECRHTRGEGTGSIMKVRLRQGVRNVCGKRKPKTERSTGGTSTRARVGRRMDFGPPSGTLANFCGVSKRNRNSSRRIVNLGERGVSRDPGGLGMLCSSTCWAQTRAAPFQILRTELRV